MIQPVCCLLSNCLVLRGPHPITRNAPQRLAAPFFSTPIFYNDWYQKVSKWEPQNGPKSQQSAKKRHRNAPTIEIFKKSLSGRGPTSKIDNPHTVSAVFSKSQGSQKGVNMRSKWSLRARKNTQNQENITLKKTQQKKRTPKSGLVLAFGGSAKELFHHFFTLGPVLDPKSSQ